MCEKMSTEVGKTKSIYKLINHIFQYRSHFFTKGVLSKSWENKCCPSYLVNNTVSNLINFYIFKIENLLTLPSTISSPSRTRVLIQYRDSLSRYGDFHYKNEAVMRPSCLENENTFTGKTVIITKRPIGAVSISKCHIKSLAIPAIER